MKIVWKEIKDFEGIYWISNTGGIKRLYKGKFRYLKPSPNKSRYNYLYIKLHTPTLVRNVRLHRIVALHFISNPENKSCVNHKDFDVSNCSVGNLEWATHKENTAWTIKAGRTAHNRGEKCGRGILTEKIVRAIIIDRKKTGLSYSKLAKKHDTNYSNVAHIIRGSRWAHINVENTTTN